MKENDAMYIVRNHFINTTIFFCYKKDARFIPYEN